MNEHPNQLISYTNNGDYFVRYRKQICNEEDYYFDIKVTNTELLFDKILPTTVTHIFKTSYLNETSREVFPILFKCLIVHPSDINEVCKLTANEIVVKISKMFQRVKSERDVVTHLKILKKLCNIKEPAFLSMKIPSMLMKEFPDTVIITKVEYDFRNKLYASTLTENVNLQFTDDNEMRENTSILPQRRRRRRILKPKYHFCTHVLTAALSFLISFTIFAALYTFNGSSGTEKDWEENPITILKNLTPLTTPFEAQEFIYITTPSYYTNQSNSSLWKLQIKEQNSKIRFRWKKF